MCVIVVIISGNVVVGVDVVDGVGVVVNAEIVDIEVVGVMVAFHITLLALCVLGPLWL